MITRTDTFKPVTQSDPISIVDNLCQKIVAMNFTKKTLVFRVLMNILYEYKDRILSNSIDNSDLKLSSRFTSLNNEIQGIPVSILLNLGFFKVTEVRFGFKNPGLQIINDAIKCLEHYKVGIPEDKKTKTIDFVMINNKKYIIPNLVDISFDTHNTTAKMMDGSIIVTDNYIVENYLGCDPRGLFVRAKEIKTNKLITIKKIPSFHVSQFENSGSSKPIEFQDISSYNYLREMQILKYSNHENISKLIEIFPPENLDQFDDLYFGIEFLRINLHHRIINSRNINDVREIMFGILNGLYYLEVNKIVHTNIRPSNILYDMISGVKIHAFGNAIIEGEQYNSHVNHLSYRSPEILLGSKNITTKSDIWSAGCIFAELLQNHKRKLLFNGLDSINKLLSTNITHLKDFSHITDMDAIDLLEKLIKFDPTQRISAKDALEHPYFQGRKFNKTISVSNELVILEPFKTGKELQNKMFEFISDWQQEHGFWIKNGCKIKNHYDMNRKEDDDKIMSDVTNVTNTSNKKMKQ